MMVFRTSNIKKNIKRIFSFVKYRWHIYAALKKSPFYAAFKSLSFTKVMCLLQYKEPGMVGEIDFSQDIFLTKNW